MKKNETSHTATGVATRLKTFCEMITHLFAPTRKRAENNAVHAKTYLQGLLSETPRKNSEAIADAAKGTQSQDLQNFMTGSQWESDDVFAHVAEQANCRIGNHPDTMLAIDESGFSKKGKFSAAVARQYNGRMGKVDNCQVGVFSSLSNGANATLIGARLFLPEEWVNDKERCIKAGIPEDQIVAASKIDLARQLIEQADAHGVEYARIGVDSFTGVTTPSSAGWKIAAVNFMRTSQKTLTSGSTNPTATNALPAQANTEQSKSADFPASRHPGIRPSASRFGMAKTALSWSTAWCAGCGYGPTKDRHRANGGYL